MSDEKVVNLQWARDKKRCLDQLESLRVELEDKPRRDIIDRKTEAHFAAKERL